VQEQYYSETWSFIIKWIAVILIVVLLLFIFIPSNIWEKEENIRKRSHWKMRQLWDAERMYYKLTGYYDSDIEGVLWFVSAVRDSILADSDYVGEEVIEYKGEDVTIEVPAFWHTEFDTVFSYPYMVDDTTYTKVFKVTEMNYETGTWDTVYWNALKDQYKLRDTLWEGVILDTTIDTIIERDITKYDRFRLRDSLMYCPLTTEPYIVKTRGKERDTVIIKSPIDKTYLSRRYLVFTFKDTGHGSIVNGEESWIR